MVKYPQKRSGLPGETRGDIMNYLFCLYRIGPGEFDYAHTERTIKDIQSILKTDHPGQYKNLTMIHRHVNYLISEGLVETRKTQFETYYRITPEGVNYVLYNLKKELAEIIWEMDQIKKIDILLSPELPLEQLKEISGTSP